ncbi:MAG: hypothetical protein KAT05_14280 [Spirochaetes bacterium]|nr:hypothetical protein [Spirochaetota bacterium]
MNLIKELQKDILNQETSLPSILRKAKVLASTLKNKEIKKWVDNELNGYDGDQKEVPNYRRGHSDINGDFIASSIVSYGNKLDNMSIPFYIIQRKFKSINNEIILTQGIRNLETLLKSDEKTFKNYLPADMVTILANEIYENYTCLKAWKSIDRGQLEQVLDTVRNRLLNFVIELQEMYPEISFSEDAISKIPNDASTSVFYTYIFGNNNIVSSGSKIEQITGGNSIMGDVFKNINNATIINKSVVKDSFIKLKKEYDDDVAKAFLQIGEFIENSGDMSAGILFDKFNEELNKPKPEKTTLKKIWGGIEKTLPTITTISEVITKISPLFNGNI